MITAETRADLINGIRTKYNVPACLQIVVKQGYVTKDVVPEPEKRERKDELHALTRNAIAGMGTIVDETSEEITRLIKAWEAEPRLRALGADQLYEQLAVLVDAMYDGLAQSIKTHIQAVYQTAYGQASGQFALVSLDDEAPFANVFASLYKAQAKMKDSIYEAFSTPVDDEKTEKLLGGLLALGVLAVVLAVALSGCEDAKEKEKLAAEHAEALAEVEADKDTLRAQGVAKYQIVLSGNENACEQCREMSGRVFAIEDFDSEVTAPPFHPNCGCSIVEFVEEAEEEPEESSEMLPLDGMTLSSEGARLLAEMEVPMGRSVVQRDDDGNMTAIRNHDIGDGGITVGFGTYVPYGPAGDAKRRELMDKYGIDASSTDVWVPIDIALRLYADEQAVYAESAIRAIERQGITEVTQQQFDAVLMQVYNSNYAAMVEAYFDNSKTDEEVVQAILDVYRTFANWDKYGAGWENRVRAQVRVFRHGEYLKDW